MCAHQRKRDVRRIPPRAQRVTLLLSKISISDRTSLQMQKKTAAAAAEIQTFLRHFGAHFEAVFNDCAKSFPFFARWRGMSGKLWKWPGRRKKKKCPFSEDGGRSFSSPPTPPTPRIHLMMRDFFPEGSRRRSHSLVDYKSLGSTRPRPKTNLTISELLEWLG